MAQWWHNGSLGMSTKVKSCYIADFHIVRGWERVLSLPDKFIHETGNEEALHEALNCMHSVGKRPMGIEQRLSNCEKVLRLLLQMQLAMLQNCNKTEQKEDEVSTNLQINFVHLQVKNDFSVTTLQLIYKSCAAFLPNQNLNQNQP